MTAVLDKHSFRQHCSNCSMASLCFPVGLSDEDITKIDELVGRQKVLHKNDCLFDRGDKFKEIYAIRSGTFKLCAPGNNDIEVIEGFYLAGELIGFNAIASEIYPATAIALETSSVCVIPFDDLFTLAGQLPALRRQLVNLMSEKLQPEFKVSFNSGAEERIATFLLSISSRLQKRGYAVETFHLSMSRQDIGTYLGLATETVSRILTKLQDKDIIDVQRREIKINDFRQLQIMSCAN
tara:strand:+ start:3425 stop:4138 length:714 start_codon:yes stop_codon:yes gene_type:complete